MTVQIRQQFVPAAVQADVTYTGTSRMVGITFHETGNAARGADAAAHANLQAGGNSRTASWHWTVDDTEAVQSFPHEARCWHAGSGTAGDGDDTVAIEVCVNADGDLAQAWRNAAELARHIRATDPRVGPLNVQHHHWSGKDCPTRLRAGQAGITWTEVLNLVTTTALEDDMTPMEMFSAAFRTGRLNADGTEEWVTVADALKAIYFYGDLAHREALRPREGQRFLDTGDGQTLRDDIAGVSTTVTLSSEQVAALGALLGPEVVRALGAALVGGADT